MDIRKHIIIFCILCCHALAVMADGQIVHKYEPISEQLAKTLFRIPDSRVEVTGMSFGDFKLVGNNGLYAASSDTTKTHSFAIKVNIRERGEFNTFFHEGKGFAGLVYQYTLIVDGKATVMPPTWHLKNMTCQLSVGEHEIVFMSNYIEGSNYPPRPITVVNLSLHAHTRYTEFHRPATCGNDGITRTRCSRCNRVEEETLPMPAAKHEIVENHSWKSSCKIPGVVTRKCIHCGISEYKIKEHKSRNHVFRNGRCVSDTCGIKLPIQNAAGIYQVGDAYELRGLAEQIAAGYIPRDCNIDLTADIIYPENLAHLPIGTTDYPFAGTFDGHGHRIDKMQSAIVTDMTGLFGVVEGTPKRLAVIANVIIESNSNLKGTSRIGGVAGWADYCDFIRCVNRATIHGNDNVGGIVGYSKRDCHVIDCAGLGIINCKEKGGFLSGTIRQGYIMDSYGSGSFANVMVVPVLAPTADSPLRHCFQLDVKDTKAGVTTFSSAQLSDGTLARMLCEKNGKGMSAHWQQGATDGCPMPIFVALKDRPASVIQSQATRAEMDASFVNSYSEEDGEDEDYGEGYEDEDEEWYSFSSESDIMTASPYDDFVFYDEADSTLNDFACYVTTTYRNVPAMPIFAAMLGGDARECEVVYCKRDSTVIMEYNYTMDGSRYFLTDATKLYTTPDSVVHVESYAMEGNERDGEFLMTQNMVFCPDSSGYKEKVSYGVYTMVADWEVSHVEGKEPLMNYYIYDEDGQQRVAAYSFPIDGSNSNSNSNNDSDKDSDKEDEGHDIQLPVGMEKTLDEFGRLKDIHYVRTDSLTGAKYNIGGQYYIYDEKGEMVQAVSYEPVEPHSSEMRQTEYTTFETYNADAPTAIIPIEHLQPGTLNGTPVTASGRVYDLRGNLVRLSSDANALNSLPKGIYITRGKKILVY